MVAGKGKAAPLRPDGIGNPDSDAFLALKPRSKKWPEPKAGFAPSEDEVRGVIDGLNPVIEALETAPASPDRAALLAGLADDLLPAVRALVAYLARTKTDCWRPGYNTCSSHPVLSQISYMNTLLASQTLWVVAWQALGEVLHAYVNYRVAGNVKICARHYVNYMF